MAIDLIKRNKCRNFIILEKSSSVGGTWNDNKYPGCCCDGKSFLMVILRSKAEADGTKYGAPCTAIRLNRIPTGLESTPVRKRCM